MKTEDKVVKAMHRIAKQKEELICCLTATTIKLEITNRSKLEDATKAFIQLSGSSETAVVELLVYVRVLMAAIVKADDIEETSPLDDREFVE